MLIKFQFLTPGRRNLWLERCRFLHDEEGGQRSWGWEGSNPWCPEAFVPLHWIPLHIGQIIALGNWYIKSIHFLKQFSVHFIPCVIAVWLMDPCIDSSIGYICIYCSIPLARTIIQAQPTRRKLAWTAVCWMNIIGSLVHWNQCY